MDNNNRQLGVGRSFYHQTHVLNGQAIYATAVRARASAALNRGGVINGIVGNWQVASIVALQSGSPLTIYSGRGTANRGETFELRVPSRSAIHGRSPSRRSMSVEEMPRPRWHLQTSGRTGFVDA